MHVIQMYENILSIVWFLNSNWNKFCSYGYILKHSSWFIFDRKINSHSFDLHVLYAQFLQFQREFDHFG